MESCDTGLTQACNASSQVIDASPSNVAIPTAVRTAGKWKITPAAIRGALAAKRIDAGIDIALPPTFKAAFVRTVPLANVAALDAFPMAKLPLAPGVEVHPAGGASWA
jgi:hypothetical protein